MSMLIPRRPSRVPPPPGSGVAGRGTQPQVTSSPLLPFMTATRLMATVLMLAGALLVVLVQDLQSAQRDQQQQERIHEASLISALAVEAHLSNSDAGQLSSNELAAVEASVERLKSDGTLIGLRLFSADRALLFSDRSQERAEARTGPTVTVLIRAGAEQDEPTGWIAEIRLPQDGLVAQLDRSAQRLYGGVALLAVVVAVSIAFLRRRALRREHDAMHDALTGLPNRILFFTQLDRAIAANQRRGDASAVLLIDLNGFKEINDTLGHPAGDLLLQQVARRLTTVTRGVDTVARMGGDEFAVVVTGLPDLISLDRAANRVNVAFSEPFVLSGTQVRVTLSVGTAIYGRDGQDADELLHKADAAMYAAKRVGGGVAHYDSARDDVAARLVALRELRTAIEQGQLRLHYQPSVRLHDRLVTGVEALVRWQHPTRGLVAPDQFIPLAEQSELIAPLTAWVVNEAVRQCRHWLDDDLDLCIAVNLSARSVVDERLPSLVRAALQRHGLPAFRLVVEITETSLIARPEDARRILTELSTLGVNIAVDDFGTGYASLAWLHQLPFNALKIDRAFVADVTSDGPGAELVRYTVQLAHAMDMVVVAEGVESAAQWVALTKMGCDHAQGYAIAPPLTAEDLRSWLQLWQSQDGGAFAPIGPEEMGPGRPHAVRLVPS